VLVRRQRQAPLDDGLADLYGSCFLLFSPGIGLGKFSRNKLYFLVVRFFC
jgi:hypothetical protein